MSQSAPFRWTRGAAQTPRQSAPFRWTRGAAQTPRQSAPFRWLRGAPFVPPPDKSLGPGIDGFIKTLSTFSLGPGVDGFIKVIPSKSLGPGIDGLIKAIPGQSVGPVQDAKVLTWILPTISVSSVSDAPIVVVSGANKPNMSVVFDSLVIGVIQPLDPNIRAPDEQKIAQQLTPRCVGTSGGIGPGVKGCENSQGELIGKV